MNAIASTAGANQRTAVLVLIEEFISASSHSPGPGNIPLNWHFFKNNAPVAHQNPTPIGNIPASCERCGSDFDDSLTGLEIDRVYGTSPNCAGESVLALQMGGSQGRGDRKSAV